MIDFWLRLCYAIFKWNKFFTFDLKLATLKDIYKVHVKGSVSSINILTELIYGKSSIAPVRGWCRERIFQAAGGGQGEREEGLIQLFNLVNDYR